MSAHNFAIKLSLHALRDIDDILLYTLINWGDVQASKYRLMLGEAFDVIKNNPYIGRKIESGVLGFSVGKHRIFYSIVKTEIHILRVLHGRMDFSGNFH